MENKTINDVLLNWKRPSDVDVVLNSYVIINNINRECIDVCLDYDSAKSSFSLMSHKDPIKNSIFMLFKLEISSKDMSLFVLKDNEFQVADEFYHEMYFDMILNKVFKKHNYDAEVLGDLAASVWQHRRKKNE